jgi:hypothetical protein
MTNLHLNIKQQIKLLPVDDSIRTRILELTLYAGVYQLDSFQTFYLQHAFDWVGSREGGDYWVDIYEKLNKNETLQ